MVHSSTDCNFLQEVKKLEKQKNEAKADEQRRDIDRRLKLRTLERDLAKAKWVRQIS